MNTAEAIKTKKERNLLIIDFEVFSNAKFWLCCIKDARTKEEYKIINNRKELINFYNEHMDSIWLGYNIRGYDQWIFKAILANISPFQVSNLIIKKKVDPWKIDKRLNKYNINFFELGNKDKSLKELELFMGESIEESSVPFELDRFPTIQEINEIVDYCMHDVNMTLKVFEFRKEDFESQEFLIDFFNLKDSSFSKTKAQLSAYILGAKKPKVKRNDEFDFEIVDTIRLSKYKHIMDWYKNYDNRDYKKSLSTTVYGTKIEFKWGGAHAAKEQYNAEGFIVNSDVASFYPALMIEYNMLSRNVENPDKFKEIRRVRLEFKKVKNKKEKSFKIVLNSTFGASKDERNELYDPQRANAICVNGQLMLLDLIEKVELKFGDRAEFIQANTDGVMFKFKYKEDIDAYMEICKEWSSRTRMELEHDKIKKISQKDVNNYIYIKEDGSIKSKGAYVKKLSPIDNDLPIVNKALINKIVYDIDIRETVEKATNLIDFQKNIKISKEYSHALHGGEKHDLKVFRVFASNKNTDGYLLKVRENGAVERIGNTPQRCFILNSNIQKKAIPSNLDREWYIDLAEKRLESFIPDCMYGETLFDMLSI